MKQGVPSKIAGGLRPRSLVRATDIDVLGTDREVQRGPDHLIVRSPSNPTFYWGNLLVFDAPPRSGDRERWIAAFAAAFPGTRHCTLAWDDTDGQLGAAVAEFPDFHIDQLVGLTAPRLDAHPRANPDVTIETLDPFGDEHRWQAVIDLWVTQSEDDPEPSPPGMRGWAETRVAELRRILQTGEGGWFVALADAEIVGSCGVVVTDGRARYQNVDVASGQRGRGIASRLVHDASEWVAARFPVETFVIVADLHYHALGIYESLGFRRTEEAAGVCRWPAAED